MIHIYQKLGTIHLCRFCDPNLHHLNAIPARVTYRQMDEQTDGHADHGYYSSLHIVLLF